MGSENGGNLKEKGRFSQSSPLRPVERKMNLWNVVILNKFTRNLRERVQNRQNDRRNFCWLDRPATEPAQRVKTSLRQEPTYQMQPQTKPAYAQCRSVIEQYLGERLKSVDYNQKECMKLSREIADDAKRKLINSDWPKRYKCIVYVSLGQIMGQGVRVSSMCAWDPANDNYITCSFQNDSLFCVVTVFAIYYE